MVFINKMKKLLVLLLLVPLFSVAQNKRELKARIVEKNDSINMLTSQINELNTKVETLESDKIKKIDSLVRLKNDIEKSNTVLLEDLSIVQSENKIKSDSIQELINRYESLIQYKRHLQNKLKAADSLLNNHIRKPIVYYLKELMDDYDNRFNDALHDTEELLKYSEYSELNVTIDTSYYDISFGWGCGGYGSQDIILYEDNLFVFNDYNGDFESSSSFDVACFKLIETVEGKYYLDNESEVIIHSLNRFGGSLDEFHYNILYRMNENICAEDEYDLQIIIEKDGRLHEVFNEYLDFPDLFYEPIYRREYKDLVFYNEENKKIGRLIFISDEKWKLERY